MNNQWVTGSLAVVLAIVILVGGGAFYTVDETEQVVITQFGEPIGKTITKAGLYFKLPIVQKANYFEKRILNWDGDPNQIPTRDKRYIWVDTTARWKIVDALKFMQSMGNETSAQARLDDIIDSATRDAISNLNHIEAIRNSNRLLEEQTKENELTDADIEAVPVDHIYVGRDEITRSIVESAKKIVPNYGIALVDVRIKRITYVSEVRQKVYERMISERKRAAERFRSEGQGKKAEIEGQMMKELQQINSEAYKTAQELKGTADAEVIKIYAEAYNNDPEFYAFLKTLETYKESIGDKTTLILSTDSEFYKYFKNIEEKAEF